MASSSSSSRNWVYDVFPSFSGEDIRRNFLSHFLKELDRNLITAFKDNEINRGLSLDPVLVEAIRNSRIAVVVFSKNYVSSSWCLNELLEIVKCMEDFGQIVMPIFYNLDPSHVRHRIGDFGKILEKTCKKHTKEVKTQWEKALYKVANLVGYHSKNWDSEAPLIENIINDILGNLNRTPSNDFEGFVGLNDHITKMSLLLDLESEEVKMVGIWGPSGIGKSTIARALYQSQLSHLFQSSIFIDRPFISKSLEMYNRGNPDEFSMKLHWQESFLSELLNYKDIKIDNLGALGERLKNRKVLILIDDLDDLMVLDALVGQTLWFGSGSRIIVVTHDKHLLQAHGIDCIYEVGLPSEELAIQMLCRSAFKQNSPPTGFEELVVEVARSAGSLPLGLKILGSSLRGKDKEYWRKMLPQFQSGLDGKIEKALRMSYDGLNVQDKAIFRHIACLFNFEKVNDIKLLLADSKLDVDIGIKNLVDMSLVHVRLNIVEMHPLLQKLGKVIVRAQSIDPGKREFLLDPEDICDVLEYATGTRRVLGISLDMDEMDELHVHESAFKGMHNLRFLKIFSNKYMLENKVRLHLPDSFDHLPPKLKLLCWDGYPMKRMPSNFRPENLVMLRMKNSKLEKLWEGKWRLRCLREINLWGSENLKEIPYLSMATNLEKFYLGNCLSWVEVRSTIRKFNELTEVGMLECRNLEALPTSINLESPKRLHLKECSRFCLENLVDFRVEKIKGEKLGQGMQPLIRMVTMLPDSLVVLFLSDIPSMVELPFSIQNLNKLTDLRITRCANLVTLPTGINLESLERLNLNGCSRLRTFPDISRNISSLYLEETSIEEVPWWIENFFKLKYLVMQRCSKLEYVYLNISKLKHLELVNFSYCGALTGADLTGYTSGMPIEAENIETHSPEAEEGMPIEAENIETNLPEAEEASSSVPANDVPKVDFSFINCFNLDQEALFQHLSVEKLILSGEEMPSNFTYRTTGTTLAISLLEAPLSPPFFRFRACAVVVFNSKPKFGAIGVSMKISCRFKDRLGNHFDSPYQQEYFSVYQKGGHLFLLECCIPLKEDNASLAEVNCDHVDIQCHMSSGNSKFKLKGWGIRLSEECSSLENRLGNPNTLPRVCEAYEDNRG